MTDDKSESRKAALIRESERLRRFAVHGIAITAYSAGFLVGVFGSALFPAGSMWVTPALLLGWAALIFTLQWPFKRR